LLEVDDGPVARAADLDHGEAIGGGVGQRHHAVEEAGSGDGEANAWFLGQVAGDRRGVAGELLVPEADKADAFGLRQPRQVGYRDAGHAIDGVETVELQGIDHQMKSVSNGGSTRFVRHVKRLSMRTNFGV
jgi:hypothetical protein